MLFSRFYASVGIERAPLSINGALCLCLCNIRRMALARKISFPASGREKLFEQEEKRLLRGKTPARVCW